ncbi:MAG: hypothetical protein Q7J84_18930 [Sulfuricaulis sp.]|nr:hypothetical protein [Sulfuricaulis sp.]
MLNEKTIKKYGDPFEWTHPINPKTGQREQQRAVWSFGGYYSNQIDRALRDDDADGFIDLMRAAELDQTSTTLDGITMSLYCKKRAAMKCKDALQKLEPFSAR